MNKAITDILQYFEYSHLPPFSSGGVKGVP